MTTYPNEAGEAEPFVPASLAHLPQPPTFFLRWGTPREKSEYRSILRREGRTQHSQEEHRQTILAGMKALFSPDDYVVWEARAKEWWDAVDQFVKDLNEARAALPDDPAPEDIAGLPRFEFEGEEMVKEVLERVALDWPRCRVLHDDDVRWNESEPHAINATLIASVENLPNDAGEPLPLVRERGSKFLTIDCAMALSEALFWAAQDAGSADPGQAVLELNRECQLKLFLGKRRAKNSDSPVPSGPTPDISKTGTGGANGKSKGSAPSRRTRDPASATPSGT